MFAAWLLLSGAAHSAECPDVREKISKAWALFDDAEVAVAKRLLAEANSELACQTRLVPADDLLELYRLDGLVSLALDDRKGAVYATIRAVAANHDGAAPPSEYGPDLAELYDTWSSRLSESTIRLTIEGGGVVYVDGRRADAGSPLDVVQGEHVLQFEDDMGTVRSMVAELEADQVIRTGSAREGGGITMQPVEPVEPVESVAEVDRSRKRPAALATVGGVALAAGGAGVLLGVLGERSFEADPYTDPYLDCEPKMPCFAQARANAIRGDATRVRAFYGSGYGLSALGVGLLSAWAIGLPVHTDGRTLGFRGRF